MAAKEKLDFLGKYLAEIQEAAFLARIKISRLNAL
jgi:hypothetical protein